MPSKAPMPALIHPESVDALGAIRSVLGRLRLSRLMIALGIVVVATFVAVVSYAIWHLRNVAIADAGREVANLSHALAEQTARAMQVVDQALSGAADRYRAASDRQPPDARVLNAQLRERAAATPQLEALLITDAQGAVQYHSSAQPAARLSYAERDFFRIQRDDAQAGLYVGAPQRSASGERWLFWVSRRLTDAQGQFRGVIAAAVETAYFDGIYRAFDLGGGSAVALYRRDALLLTRYPFNEQSAGRSFADSPLFETDGRAQSARVLQDVDPVDGVRRLTGVEPVPDYPLMVSVATADSSVLGAWRQQLLLFGSSSAAVAALLALLFALLARQLTRHETLLDRLRESEERFRNLADLSSDWYWEQDREFRYTAISSGIRKIGVTPEQHVIGRTRWEVALIEPPSEGWDAHKALLAAQLPFHDLILRCRDADGNIRFTSSSGRPIFDEAGRFRGYRGIGKDVTESMLAAARQHMEHAVARLVAASDAVDATLPSIIETVCRTLGWECGARWALDPASQLIVRAESWSRGAAPTQAFLARTAARAFPVDSGGIISAAWRGGEPRWIGDIGAEPKYMRGPLAVSAGLRSAFLLPIASGGRVNGVIEFLGGRIARPDPMLLESMRAIAAQTGQFIERKRIEEALRTEKEYVGHIISSAPTIICCIAPDGTTRSVNKAITFVTGYAPEEVIGRNWWRLLYPGDDYAQVERLLNAFEKGRVVNYEMTLTTKSGDKRVVSWSSANRFDERGELLEIIAIGADVTKRKRTEARQAMEHAVTRALAESGGAEQTMPRIIETICTTLGWDCGAERYLDDAGRVLCGATWTVAVPEIARFIEACRSPVPLNPNGIVGRTLAARAPQWVRDLSDVRRAPLAFAAGLRAAFAFPVLADGAAVGTLEFFSRDIREPEPELLETALAIGSQIGQLMTRQRAEGAQRAADQQLRLIAENVPDVVYQFRLDADGAFSFPFVSERVRDLYGVCAGEVMRDYRLVFDPVLPAYRGELLKSMLRSKRQRRPWSFEAPIRAADGALKWVRGQSAVSFPADGAVVWDGVLSDVTAQKLAELEVQRLNESLEQRVAERTAELSAVNRELEAFAYSVSHDLRAPLRSINGFSRIVLEQTAGRLDPEAAENLQRVRAAGHRMEQLIDDLLRLSRVTRGELRRVPVDLSAMAEAIAAELTRGQPQRAVRFDIAPGLTAHADPELMRILLDNLLNNAWKFTQKQASALIEVGAVQQYGKTVYHVRDDGAGFDMAYADKLFGAFQRLHGPAEFEGTGVGLATVQRIIHRHGGRVWAEARPGAGATFYFTVA